MSPKWGLDQEAETAQRAGLVELSPHGTACGMTTTGKHTTFGCFIEVLGAFPPKPLYFSFVVIFQIYLGLIIYSQCEGPH